MVLKNMFRPDEAAGGRGRAAQYGEDAERINLQAQRGGKEREGSAVPHQDSRVSKAGVRPNQELQGKQKELVDDYMKRIASATQTVAEKGGFSIVVDKGSEQTVKIVIYNKDTIDLTDQVIKEFDRVNSK